MVAPGRAAPQNGRMSRRLIAVIACLLLLGLQHEAARHGVRHVGEQVAAAHERTLALPAVACDECALLAGASVASVGHAVTTATAAPVHTPLLPPDGAIVATAAHHYAARAPPLRS